MAAVPAAIAAVLLTLAVHLKDCSMVASVTRSETSLVACDATLVAAVQLLLQAAAAIAADANP